MQCSFTLSKDDYKALMKVVGKRLIILSSANTKQFFSNFIVWCFIGIAVAIHISMFQKHPEISRDLLFVSGFTIAAFAAAMIGTAYRNRIVQNFMLAKDSWFYSEQTVVFSPSGLSASGTYGKAEYGWSAFQHVAEDSSNLYLFLDNCQAYVLPKTALTQSGVEPEVRKWLKAHETAA